MNKPTRSKIVNTIIVLGAVSATVAALYSIAVKIATSSTSEQAQRTARFILEKEGFKEVRATGFNFWCPKGVSDRFLFEAVDDTKTKVKGEYCGSNLIRNSSIKITKRF